MDEALLAYPLLTSYCAIQFLTGYGPVLVDAAWGLGTIDLRDKAS